MKYYLSIFAAVLLLAGCAHHPQAGSADPGATEGQSRFAQYGTNRVHYVVQGHGQHALVLVHCWSGNLGFWREQVPALAPHARVLLVDLPGHGQSDKPHTAYSMDFMAGAVLAAMRDAHIEKATLIGHSMGTPVICRVYHQAPERVAGLVAVDGMLRRPAMSAEQAEQFIGRFRAADYGEKTREFLGTMFPAPGTEALRDRVIGEILNTPQYVMLGAMEGMFQPDQPDWAPGQVKVPVMVINTTSPMWSDEYKEYVRSLSAQTDYRTIDGAGHWLMLEKPRAFNGLLLDQLRRFELIAKGVKP